MDDDAQIFSIIGGARRSGRWRVPASTKTVTLFGRCLIDLRQAETLAEELEFNCFSLFAVVTFIVPEGAEVRPSGMAVLASARSLVPVSDEPGNLPPISIDAVTVIGRLRIRTTDEEPEAERSRGTWRERRRARRKKATAAAIEARTDDGLVDLAPIRRDHTDLDDQGGLVDLAPVRHDHTDLDDEGGLVDLKPIRRPLVDDDGPVDLAPVRRPSDAAVPLLDGLSGPAPERALSGFVDPPIPAGTIDEIPGPFTGFETPGNEKSPLTGLEVPDSPGALSDDTAGR